MIHLAIYCTITWCFALKGLSHNETFLVSVADEVRLSFLALQNSISVSAVPGEHCCGGENLNLLPHSLRIKLKTAEMFFVALLCLSRVFHTGRVTRCVTWGGLSSLAHTGCVKRCVSVPVTWGTLRRVLRKVDASLRTSNFLFTLLPRSVICDRIRDGWFCRLEPKPFCHRFMKPV